MSQAGFTPIQLYFSTTAAATPSAGNLANGELAINITDGRLFYKDNGGVVRVLAGTGGTGVVAGSNTQVQFNNNGVFGASANMVFNGTRLTVADLADSGLTSGRVTYASSGGALVDSANLTFDGTTLTAAGLSDSGNLTFTGTGNRITGDFSNATILNRVAFQNSTVNAGTSLTVLPNGTGASSAHNLYAGSDPTNTSFAQFRIGTDTSDVRIVSGNTGTGAYLPIAFHTNGSEQMRLTSTGLGIGTSSVVYKLAVNSSTTVVAGFTGTGTNAYTPTASTSLANSTLQLFGGNGSGSTTGIRMSQGGSFELYIGGVQEAGGAPALVFQGYNGSVYAERMRLDSSGNLGLGVTPSAWGSYKASQINDGAVADISNNQIIVSKNAFYDGSNWRYINSNFASFYQQFGGEHRWQTAPSGTAGNAISFTQAMTLDASGNLLVGTTSDGFSGRVAAYGSGAYVAYSANNITDTNFSIRLGGSAGNVAFRALPGSGQGSISFEVGTAGQERARIDSSGNLLVGTTSSPGAKFAVEGNFDSSFGQRINGSNSSTGLMIQFQTQGTERGYILSTSGGTTYATSSDYRLKNTIAPMTGALAKVALLKPCTYKWNADGSAGEGFIAHELAEVCPHAVAGEKDAVDAEGKPQYQGIDTSFLVATLTAAIQEQQALIASLTARVAALESN